MHDLGVQVFQTLDFRIEQRLGSYGDQTVIPLLVTFLLLLRLDGPNQFAFHHATRERSFIGNPGEDKGLPWTFGSAKMMKRDLRSLH